MVNPLLIGVLVAAFVFEFINGFHDVANSIATPVFTGALDVPQAIIMSVALYFIGAVMSDSVAMTIATGLIDGQLELQVILAALLGAIFWNLYTWWFSIPSSPSHALIGALCGSAMVFLGGPQAVIWGGLVKKVIIPLFTSPLLGIILGYLIMRGINEIFAYWHRRKAEDLFLKAQIASSGLLSWSHGTNGSQKTMGIITLALISAGYADPTGGVPFWVKVFCFSTIALGAAVGAGRVMRTVGSGVTKLEPATGFAAEFASSIAIGFMTLIGAPVSTTHVKTSSIMGVGSVKRLTSVKWSKAGDIVTAWFITLPISMALGAAAAFIFSLFM